MLPVKNEPYGINKQDKNTDTQYKGKQAVDTHQKLSEARYQQVCSDENNDGQENKNE